MFFNFIFTPSSPPRKNCKQYILLNLCVFSELWVTAQSFWYYSQGTLKGFVKKFYNKISLKHITKKEPQFDQIFPGQMTSPQLASYLVIEVIGCYHWNPWKHKWCIQLFLPALGELILLQQLQQDACSLHKNEGQTEVKKLCVIRVIAKNQTKPKEGVSTLQFELKNQRIRR